MPSCVISQPRFFPGLHYLHRMMVTDVFVVLDTVQYTPQHEENRAKVKGLAGPQWLTVPVRQSRRDQLLGETRPDDTQSWRRKLIGTLTNLYAPAPCFKAYAPEIIRILEAPYETLTALDRASWEPALRLLGVTCQFVCASELPLTGKGSELLLQIAQYLGSTVYISGSMARDYLDVAAFAAARIEVVFHHYEYPVYPQRHGDFAPFLSYLDMLFNVGLDRETVLAGGRAGGTSLTDT
jgi:hypothetical protein